MKHKLEADSIILEFGNRKLLSDIYISCTSGEICGLLGRNGTGKSSLMNIIYGSLKADGKSVRIDGASVPEAYKRADLLTYLPQFHFIPANFRLKRVFADFGQDFEIFTDMFPEFKDRKDEPVRNLSGGQRRLAEVYLIIRSRAAFSMLDEPFSHLMPLHVASICSLLTSEKRYKGFLITDHLYRQVSAVCDSLYILKDGKTHRAVDDTDIVRLGYARL